MMAEFPLEGDEFPDKMREILGPDAVDRQIRQAITFCWIMLPTDARSVDRLEAEIRRLVDRALRDFREDRAAFGASCVDPDE